MRLVPAILLSLAALLVPPPAAAELRLVMVEQPGCAYCKMWDRDVADAYAASPQGAAAPLARIGLRDPLPEGLRLVSRPVFTPTFILVKDGAESGRIEGYQSADFFWGHIDRLLAAAGVDAGATASAD